jgi:hypothetical protein
VALLHSVGEHAEPSYSFLPVAAATCGHLIDILLDEADKAAGSPVTGAETLTRSRPDTAREAHALPSLHHGKGGSRMVRLGESISCPNRPSSLPDTWAPLE